MNAINGNSSAARLEGFDFEAVRSEYGARIVRLSGLPDVALKEAAIELKTDCMVSFMDGTLDRPDSLDAVRAMWRSKPLSWSGTANSSLHGFSLAQIFAAWAWGRLDAAGYFLSERATTDGWGALDAFRAGMKCIADTESAIEQGEGLIKLQVAGDSYTAIPQASRQINLAQRP